MRDPGSIVYLDMDDDFFWSSSNNGIAFSYNTLPTATDAPADMAMYGFENDEGKQVGLYTILDTGSSHMLLGRSYFAGFFDVLMKYSAGPGKRILYYSDRGSIFTRDCGDRVWPTVYFMLDTLWVEVRPQDYLYDASDASDWSLCGFYFT